MVINRILVGLDGSKNSKIAGEYGIYLSKKLKRPVVGVHIIDIRLLEGPFLTDIAGGLGFTVYSDLLPKIKEILETKAEAILDEFVKECREKGGDCTIAQAYGIVVNEIVDMADPDDLIIVGKHGEHPEFIPLLLGSTAEDIARKSKSPVMIVPDCFKEINNILLAFDGREKSQHAASYLYNLAKELGINNIKVISVLSDMVKDKDKEEMIKSQLKEILKDLSFEIIFRYGEPEERIMSYLDENKDLDLVVMGAYGESRIRELILGSTTSYIAINSKIPVLLVK
ncbi:universal stress protein [Venenivibrio stagnispumantis]|uniref:Nucleotide-binding universal stress protein, UspA family n=1 Tax=Venenivibrio stagnispumantis TaxID=407998 RepID=A0AA46AD90_9AQUI|nr:universal stress protein [Venenivibrio stagnispumantis]MCW4572427.1 universal stress protein [Venenivibrio stagnispumantis]SMP03304.1 Nucleotide-binding universal stress protein, UspA family [Venenivibrio stagnispumantis]